MALGRMAADLVVRNARILDLATGEARFQCEIISNRSLSYFLSISNFTFVNSFRTIGSFSILSILYNAIPFLFVHSVCPWVRPAFLIYRE
jgi:hypothetical protein